MPAVTLDLIICTYNNASLLRRTLTAMEQQVVTQPVHWQVLVVNNNCTDDTNAVVAQHQQNGILLLHLLHEPRQGLSAARQCGVRHSGADWIAFIDDDGLLAKDWVEQTTRFALQHPHCGAFGGKILLQWEGTPPPYLYRYPYAFAGKNHGDTTHRRQWLAGLGMTLRRQALLETGWLDNLLLEDRIGDRLVSGGDMEISLRMAQHFEIWYVPACLIRHIIPPRRMTRAYLRRMLFGLGASRHQVRALTWKHSFGWWLPFAGAYFLGMVGVGFVTWVAALLRRRPQAGFGVALSPALGWAAAAWHLGCMKPARRNQILGAVLPTALTAAPDR